MKDRGKLSCADGCGGFVVGGVSLSPNADASQAFGIVAEKLKRAGINPARLAFDIFKRSIDARKKKDIKIVYSVAVHSKDGSTFSPKLLQKISAPITPIIDGEPSITYGNQQTTNPPLVIGMGPAGLFCALLLAENGYSPIIIDRGDGIAERCKKTEVFFGEGILDCESNIQFGAGGAGTFSDGKLVTRVGDVRVNYVLKRFCDFGAPDDIKVSAKPHIGTDLLINVVDRMLARIQELGGKVIYRCKMTDICEENGEMRVKTTAGDIPCSCAVLATGHSARDVYSLLIDKAYSIEPKAFSLGVRIEHLQKDIDRALFGDLAGHPALGRGEYHLSDTSMERGVYTFCMCPGGQVVAAASESGGVVVNGMSDHARDGVNANSAVLVSVRPEDYGNDFRRAVELQRRLEHQAYIAGGEDYYAPYQTVGDFLNGISMSEPTRILPTYRGGKVRAARLDKLLPEYVTREMKSGLLSFERKIHGFACSDAILTGVETRSSAPMRILRGSELYAPMHDRVYPCGEGAGYAGGISSAAVDGIKVAEKIMARFARVNKL